MLRLPGTLRLLPRRPGLVLIIGLALLPACEGQAARKPAPARPQGVVGHVTALQGKVSWSTGGNGPRTALAVGDAVRAEWTLHTEADARVTLRLANGHVWSLGESTSKRAAEIQALSLAPVQGGALDRLADRGGPMEVDRTGAAGIQQERSAAGKAVSSHAPEPQAEDKEPEGPRPPAPRAVAEAMGRGASAVAPRPLPPPPPSMSEPMVSGLTRSGGSGGGGSKGTASLSDLLRESSMSSPSGAGPSGGEAGGLPEKLSTADVRAAMNRLMPELRKCFSQHKVAGVFAMRIELSGQGRVQSVAATGSGAGTPTGQCLERGLRRLTTPPFRSPSMSFVYPITFR